MFKLSKKWLGLFLLIGFVVTLFVLKIASPSEPTHQAQPLSFWLGLLESRDPETVQQAKTAVASIGTNGVPFLVRRLHVHSNPLKRTLRKMASKLSPKYFNLVDDQKTWRATVAGFAVVREQAIGALPELTRMLEDPREAVYAANVLPYLGEPAFPVLTNAMNSPDPIVRGAAISFLYLNPSFGSRALPIVVRLLDDKNALVRQDAIGALGQMHIEPETVVPLLITRLSDTNSYTVYMTVTSLSRFDWNAESALPSLMKLCQSTNMLVRRAAVVAVKKIDPHASHGRR